ncbi:MAG: 4Fe-4S dicluster domain-containing protein [Fodinibius sp.]|nr:4Fe-4S dicluster domain-containing protein [Fodinibius sp.]MDZ7659379.1 4Fe-4S dicluster domain-containing protein [Fodinibius sp.]
MNEHDKSKKAASDLSVVAEENQLKEIFGQDSETSAEKLPENNRKGFLKKAATILGMASMSLPTLVKEGLAAVTEDRTDEYDAQFIEDMPVFDIDEEENMIIRMQKELQTAMEKPIEERSWVMIIDLRKCTGCGACTVSCVAENHLPAGVVYRPVIEEEIGTYPNVSQQSLPRPCMQCEEPPCVPVCPVNATWVRPDGIIDMDYDQCIGCKYCITACPYHARTFDFGINYTDGTPAKQPYEKAANYEYNKGYTHDDGDPVIGSVRKCHFCTHKLEEGMLPSCVTTCIGYATYFGDANNQDSLVSELLGQRNQFRLKEELGTKPRVYYLT